MKSATRTDRQVSIWKTNNLMTVFKNDKKVKKVGY